jgi:hypothetical protein
VTQPHEYGDWSVDIENGYVKLQMTEFDESGGEQKNYFFPPHVADTIADAMIDRAEWIRRDQSG